MSNASKLQSRAPASPVPPRLTAVAAEYDVCVVGLGATGARIAAAASARGLDVAGFDQRADAVARFNRADVGSDAELIDQIEDGLADGHLRAFDGAARAKQYIICAGPELRVDGRLDTTALDRAIETTLDAVEPGNLVVLEASAQPGTLRSKVAERLEEIGLEPGVDVFVAVASSGNGGPALVGGMTPACTERAADFYRELLDEAVLVTSAESCELVRLAETAYREVNAAFANEVSNVCSHLGLDVWDVLSLARVVTGAPIARPGPGPADARARIDPELFASACAHDTPLTRSALELNAMQPARVVTEVRSVARRFVKPTIACLGLSYGAEGRLNQSPAVRVAEMVAREGLGEVLVVDSSVEHCPVDGAALVSLDRALRTADIVVLLTPDPAFESAPRELYARPCVIDTLGLLSRDTRRLT